jgi:hypothetical protein
LDLERDEHYRGVVTFQILGADARETIVGGGV